MCLRATSRWVLILLVPGMTIVSVFPLLAAPPPVQPANVLPASLYFIGANSQIHRLEANGTTQIQLTHSVSFYAAEFDVSLVDGALAYVENNNLMIADAHGANPRLLFSGGAVELDADGYPTTNALLTTLVAVPRWSPDGAQIAFSYGGSVYLIPAAGGEARLLLSVGQPVADSPPEMPVGARFYRPDAWAPIGSRLSVTVLYVPEGTGLLVLDTANPAVVSIEYLLCCGSATWSLDGTRIYYSSPAFVFGISGLWLVDPAVEQPFPLIEGSTPATPNLANMIIGAQQLDDGRLYFFFGTFNFDDPDNSGALRMVRTNAGGGDLEALRADTYAAISEALWALDGSGAVITAEQLLWLKTDGNPAVILAETGRNLRWGLPE